MNIVKQYVLSAIVMLALDFVYLSFNKSAYETMVVHIQRVVMKVKVLPALVCYVFLIFGLNYFILSRRRSVLEAFLLGLVIYGVYDSTNLAIFKKWDTKLALMDGLWGGVLFALTAAIVYAL